MKDKRKNQSQNNILSALYFANTYLDDKTKVKNMKKNVEYDLKPFMAYLEASINQIGKSSSKGAEIRVWDDNYEKYLVPQFSLIKPRLPGKAFIMEKPSNIFILDCEDEFDTNTFEVTMRKEQICSHEDVVDCYQGIIFLQGDFSGFLEKKLHLYDEERHKDESLDCRIEAIDFAGIDSYRIEGMAVDSVTEEGDKLVVHINEGVYTPPPL